MIAENPIRVFAHSEGLARLSIAVLICACAWPPIGTKAKSAAFDRAMAAFIAGIERANGVRVSMQSRAGRPIRGEAWRNMTRENGAKLIQLTGHRLMMRRFPAIELRLRLMLGPEGQRVTDTKNQFGRILAARAEQAEFYRRGNVVTESMARNTHWNVWRESRPVLHLAHALQEAFFAADVSPWNWPALACAPDPQARLRRLVAEAETAQRLFQGGGAGFSIRPAEQLRIKLD